MNPPANWYPDPTGRHGQRYWDGEQWTEHVFTDGVQDVDPLDGGTAAQGSDAGAVEAEEGSSTEQEGVAAAAQDPGEASDDDVSTELFTNRGEPTAEAAEDEATWRPEEQDQDAAADDEAVAPEVEAEDVLGSLDEVVEGEAADVEDSDTVAAAAGSAPDPAEQQDASAETPADDFSDAFMVTPETVSRLVSRQATTEPQAAGDTEDDQAAAPDEGAEGPADEPTGSASTGDEAAGAPGAIDAPPPSTSAPTGQIAAAAPTTEGGLGISGDLVGGAFAEREETGPVGLQNSRLLRCSLQEGPGVIARQGTMVAYQGEVSFERQGAGGLTRALKRAATGEGLAMMRSEGTGDVFFADGGQHVFLLHLEGGPGLSVNGRNVLAFSAALDWDIERIKGATLLAGGLFNTTLTGTGWVALVSDGEPVVLRTEEAPTHVDVNALVAWSGGLATRITSSVSAKSLVGLGSGEAFQMAFEGTGIVIVQPSEGPLGGAAAS